MSSQPVIVWMRVHEQESNPPSPERVEVFRFDWERGHALPRDGETICADGWPLIVSHVTWDPDTLSGLHPTIEVYRRPDHPALAPKEDEATG